MSALGGLTLDTGALIAFERADEPMRALLAAAARERQRLTIPSVVIVEAWRGGHGRWMRDLTALADVEALTEALARRAGELLARTATANTIDAVVAVSAAQRGDVVLTADPGDLQRYADELRTIRVKAI